MPGYLQPKTHIQHRIAAIALYRALLSRCTSAHALHDKQRTSLHNAIRNKFRQNRKLQSPRQLGLVFQAGYEILDHLDACTTSKSKSLDTLNALISTLPRGIARTPPQPRREKPPSDPTVKDPLAVLPPEKALLNVRPYAKTSGPRHVPILASANGIPFLRITKPQPPALSRVLRQKLERRIEKFHEKILFSNYWIPIARYEDIWDSLLESECGFVEEHGTEQAVDESKWSDEILLAAKTNSAAYEQEMAADRGIAAKMTALVDKEKELALQEGQKIVRGRKARPIRDRWLK